MATHDLFCYGLFADAGVLREYGVAPTASRRAVLRGYALVIADRALMVPHAGSETAGIVHTLTDTEVAQLYSAPGLTAYAPSAVEVQYDNGSRATVMTYNLDESEAAKPSNAEYAVKLRASRTRLGLPVDAGASPYQLAQLNVGVLIAPLESPLLADFVANLERINALADRSPGFVWRLQTADGNATALRPFGDDTLVNMSVWEDFESLRRFVYQSDHASFVRRRREFFQRSLESILVLWWVPRGHIPELPEAKERLDRLRLEGPTPEAFEFRRIFAAPTTAPRR
jgi:hypothetical protein